MTTIDRVLERSGPFAEPEFEPGPDVRHGLETMKILVIGAGGLGCEILKNLALSGFKDIHVIDMDTIDLSNLNRQFLFRESDIGSSKAEVAARFIESRVKGVKVTPYFGKIQDKDESYYKQFAIVVCGLDSVEARRWINSMLVDMAASSTDPDMTKIMIDGGTEGFRGQIRVILPTISPCYECSLDMQVKQTTYPICTIANTPRVPEHCIEWASVLQFPHHFDVPLDTDNPQHIQWIYEQALQRAKQFNIEGLTYTLTQGIVKNIIPAIASTNAVIAAASCNEAFKIATSCNPFLENYMMYSGNDGVFTHAFIYQKRQDCPVCGNIGQEVTVPGDWLLETFIEYLSDNPKFGSKKPSISSSDASLYLQSPQALREATAPNLEKELRQLITSGQELVVTDPSLPFELRLQVFFK